MGQLDSKVVVITGGSMGIGREIAERCVKEGATVVVGARGEDGLNETLASLQTISEKAHQSYRVDVAKAEDVGGFVMFCSKQFPEIHGLVNCAGVYGPIGKTTDVDIEKFIQAIQINFLGTAMMCHSFAPLFTSAGKQKIINYSGGGAAGPFPRFSAYATSKSAIVRFTENLAMELSDDGFDVNCIAPGFVITRLHQETLNAGPEAATQAFYENTKKQIESGGVPAEKAAELTVFLLSDASNGITGKFLSAPWDPWQDDGFQERLRNDKDFATLRRIDDKTFFKKNLMADLQIAQMK